MPDDSSNGTSFLRVVLMCLGRGSDPNAFQPNRDESMWWLRRDSLVRIVASYLFIGNDHSKELILLFEEDYARMELKRSDKTTADYPTEQRLVGLWKSAALAPGTLLERHGLSCRLVLDPNMPISTNESFDSKRQLLEHLQKHCSLDFLREHRLNSEPAVVLRKTNKQALEGVHRKWMTSQKPENAESDSETPAKHSRLGAIYRNLLQSLDSSSSTVIAAILHESCDSELPCWGALPRVTEPTTFCLFLGAVRDMHPYENRILQDVASPTPLVRVRLGPVPEFTSKILTVVGHHHSNGRLGPAMVIMGDRSKQHSKHEDSYNKQEITSDLHIVALVPIPSNQLSSTLKDRSRVLWCLVRIIVNTLWRSRVASAEHDNTSLLKNQLTLVFSDNLYIRLEQEDWVTSLAQQHHAAPSEYQILAALCKREIKSDLQQSIQVSLDGTYCLADIWSDGGALMASVSYAIAEPRIGNGGRVMALLRIRDDTNESSCTDGQAKSIRKLCKIANVPVVKTSFSSCCDQDDEGATVTMLQHLYYQNRLLPSMEILIDKKKSKRSKKKRQRKV